MKSIIIRKALNIFIIILTILSIFLFIMCIGGGGVLNDLYHSLEEMEDLERKNLLESTRKYITYNEKRNKISP